MLEDDCYFFIMKMLNIQSTCNGFKYPWILPHHWSSIKLMTLIKVWSNTFASSKHTYVHTYMHRNIQYFNGTIKPKQKTLLLKLPEDCATTEREQSNCMLFLMYMFYFCFLVTVSFFCHKTLRPGSFSALLVDRHPYKMNTNVRTMKLFSPPTCCYFFSFGLFISAGKLHATWVFTSWYIR